MGTQAVRKELLIMVFMLMVIAAVPAFAQSPIDKPLQQVTQWMVTAIHGIGALAIIIGGADMIWGSGHNKMKDLIGIAIGLGIAFNAQAISQAFG